MPKITVEAILINYLMTTSTNPYWEKKNPTIIKNTAQARLALSKLVEGELPKKIPIPDFPVGPYEGGKANGFNQAITQTTQNLKKAGILL